MGIETVLIAEGIADTIPVAKRVGDRLKARYTRWKNLRAAMTNDRSGLIKTVVALQSRRKVNHEYERVFTALNAAHVPSFLIQLHRIATNSMYEFLEYVFQERKPDFVRVYLSPNGSEVSHRVGIEFLDDNIVKKQYTYTLQMPEREAKNELGNAAYVLIMNFGYRVGVF